MGASHNSLDGLHYATLTEVARLIESCDISPVDLTQSMFHRIEAIDGNLKSYVSLTPERALAAATKAEQEIASGKYRGRLHGIPVAVKDLCYTKGIKTMGGLSVFKDFLPGYDGTAVSRLEEAGAVLLGKLNMTEGAGAGYHPDFEVPVNPWNPAYWAGTSSSGSGVAVAAGLCFAALGSDTGGSIRFPAMANGIVGLKPTYGRVSRYGVHALAETLDQVGPMARSVADAAVVLETIAGHDINDRSSLDVPVPNMLLEINSGIAGMQIGYDREFSTDGTDSAFIVAIEDALHVLERLGATIVEVSFPSNTVAIGDAWFPICLYEAAKAHASTFPSRADEYGQFLRDFLAQGSSITKDQYTEAMEVRKAFTHQFFTLLETVDAVICPAGNTLPPLPQEAMHGGMEDLLPVFEGVQTHFTMPANLAGTPALTVPCGSSHTGMQYAMQILGPQLAEARLCRIGQAYEQATNWHNQHPPV